MSTGSSEDVYAVALDHAKLPVASTDLQRQLFILGEAQVFVRAQLEICPLLVNLLLLTVHDLLNFLGLLVSLEELSGAESLRIAILLGAALDDVEDRGDVWRWSILEPIYARGMHSRNSLAIDMLVALSLDTEGRLMVGIDLGLYDSVLERHGETVEELQS
jgi:hypothetical protein